ncbi:hypothetical protein NQ318_006201 [Aromia moschata]|uniref:RNase H type-1 domain-containing protein n=1 Tax=Aromia moschata TaxID=1265417 RepID=A0AAV8YEV9_9CUCU|nr:hypothetical protein NQ318_006201 [Aromia moschata]
MTLLFPESLGAMKQTPQEHHKSYYRINPFLLAKLEFNAGSIQFDLRGFPGVYRLPRFASYGIRYLQCSNKGPYLGTKRGFRMETEKERLLSTVTKLILGRIISILNQGCYGGSFSRGGGGVGSLIPTTAELNNSETACLTWTGHLNLLFEFSVSQAALMAIESSKVKSRLVLDCKKILNDLASCNRVILTWIPGHSGVPGNEEADRLARLGSIGYPIGPEPILGSPIQWGFQP